MNGSEQMEVHYLNSGFPYAITETFMDLFEGIPHMPQNYAQIGAMHDQENVYWSTNANLYKFGLSGSGSTYYGAYEVTDHIPRTNVSRSAWEYPSTMYVEEFNPSHMQSGGNAVMDAHAIVEECTSDHESTTGSQVIWQDNIDPDNMTYEELLDLGEAVGTESRGLSDELIHSLPTSKYKRSNFFSRKSRERCVICQMRYKRGDRQMKLPCKHLYHPDCISKWLSISKLCPVCNVEVFGEGSKA